MQTGRWGYILAGDFGSHNLADDITIGEADDKTVLGSVVLVLGLGDEAFAGIVVGFPLSTALVFGLVAAGLQSAQFTTRTADNSRRRRKGEVGWSTIPIVGAVLDQLGERL